MNDIDELQSEVYDLRCKLEDALDRIEVLEWLVYKPVGVDNLKKKYDVTVEKIRNFRAETGCSLHNAIKLLILAKGDEKEALRLGMRHDSI